MRVVLSLCLVSIFAAGCPVGDGQEVEVSGELVIPVEVQRLFSPERRGAVVIDPDYTDIPGQWGPMVAGILCEPQADDLVIPFAYRKDFGCAQEIAFKAWVHPVSTGTNPAPTCGPVPRALSVADRTMTVARGEDVANQGKTKCVSGEVKARIRLSLVP